jgi:hypothetical protein
MPLGVARMGYLQGTICMVLSCVFRWGRIAVGGSPMARSAVV